MQLRHTRDRLANINPFIPKAHYKSLCPRAKGEALARRPRGHPPASRVPSPPGTAPWHRHPTHPPTGPSGPRPRAASPASAPLPRVHETTWQRPPSCITAAASSSKATSGGSSGHAPQSKDSKQAGAVSKGPQPLLRYLERHEVNLQRHWPISQHCVSAGPRTRSKVYSLHRQPISPVLSPFANACLSTAQGCLLGIRLKATRLPPSHVDGAWTKHFLGADAGEPWQTWPTGVRPRNRDLEAPT